MRVKDVMTTSVLTVEEDTSFKDTVELLIEHRVSGAPVVDRDGHLVGLVTEADLVSKEAFDLRHRRPMGAVFELISGQSRWSSKAAGLTAGAVMTSRVVTAAPGEDVRAAARRMLDSGVKRLPVVEHGRLVGIVSRQDILRIFDRPDAEIAAELEARMARPIYAPEDHAVTASVKDGVVTLTGSVHYSGEVPVMEGLASNVAGVVHVDNHVTYDAADGS
jgi:CBS domain-containing protein